MLACIHNWYKINQSILYSFLSFLFLRAKCTSTCTYTTILAAIRSTPVLKSWLVNEPIDHFIINLYPLDMHMLTQSIYIFFSFLTMTKPISSVPAKSSTHYLLCYPSHAHPQANLLSTSSQRNSVLSRRNGRCCCLLGSLFRP